MISTSEIDALASRIVAVVAAALSGKPLIQGSDLERALIAHKWLKKHLTGRAQEALYDFEAAPDLEDNKADLRKQLARFITTDPSVSDALREIMPDSLNVKETDNTRFVFNSMPQPMFRNLEKIATGHFGRFRMSDGFRQELRKLRDSGYIATKSIRIGDIPTEGADLSDFVYSTELGKEVITQRLIEQVGNALRTANASIGSFRSRTMK